MTFCLWLKPVASHDVCERLGMVRHLKSVKETENVRKDQDRPLCLNHKVFPCTCI